MTLPSRSAAVAVSLLLVPAAAAEVPKPPENVSRHRPAPSLADPLLAVINNPKGSAADKLYAFQGLRNLLDQSDANEPSRHIFGASAGNPKLGEIAIALPNYVIQKRTPRDDKERAVIE